MWPTRAVNAEFFGRPGVNKGEQAAFPQARVVALAECGTHAMFDAAVGAYTTVGEHARRGRWSTGWSRGWCCSPTGGSAASRCGARPRRPARTCCGESEPTTMAQPGHVETSPTGRGWPSCARPAPPDRHAEPMTVRVDRLHASTTAATTPPAYRLFTTILDPAEAAARRPRRRLRPALGDRAAFDELKTHQRGPRTVLRSKSPDLVLQEIWGHLCCHYAIRTPDVRSRRPRRTSTPTGSASSPRCASPAAPSPSRALFPPTARH